MASHGNVFNGRSLTVVGYFTTLQIDNAQDFAEMGFLETVIVDLNTTSTPVRINVALVIGAATQRYNWSSVSLQTN